MKVTDVRVNEFSGKGKLVAFADIVIEGALKVTGLKIINGSKGLFVNMPSIPIKKDGETEWKELVYPINKEMRTEIQDAVLKEYKNKTNKGGSQKSDSEDELFG